MHQYDTRIYYITRAYLKLLNRFDFYFGGATYYYYSVLYNTIWFCYYTHSKPINGLLYTPRTCTTRTCNRFSFFSSLQIDSPIFITYIKIHFVDQTVPLYYLRHPDRSRLLGRRKRIPAHRTGSTPSHPTSSGPTGSIGQTRATATTAIHQIVFRQ